MIDKQENAGGKVLEGAVTGILIVVAVECLLAATSAICSSFQSKPLILVLALFQVGWVQLLYLPLAGFYSFRKGKHETRKGIWILSGILFLITSGCNVLLGGSPF